MKKAAAAAAAAVLLAGLGALWAARPGEPVRVEIPEGLGARRTAELLAREGVVHSTFGFRVFLKLTGFDRQLKPGTYTLRRREWPTVVARKLTLGLTEDVKVTIPEGFMAAQIAERLAKAGAIADAAAFHRHVDAKRLEGRLFPSTYHFPPGYSAEKAAAMMTAEFERQIGAAWAAAPRADMTLEQAVTLASIVEREAVLKQERPIIAAVYLNRLQKKMPLQADPTVQYALGREDGVWKKGLTRSDLQLPSPYNTYARRGLPPGPICSPGLESFKAVLAPAKTSALYFVADMTGGHLFSETNEEHSKARMIYKKELRKAKEKLKREAAAQR